MIIRRATLAAVLAALLAHHGHALFGLGKKPGAMGASMLGGASAMAGGMGSPMGMGAPMGMSPPMGMAPPMGMGMGMPGGMMPPMTGFNPMAPSPAAMMRLGPGPMMPGSMMPGSMMPGSMMPGPAPAAHNANRVTCQPGGAGAQQSSFGPVGGTSLGMQAGPSFGPMGGASPALFASGGSAPGAFASGMLPQGVPGLPQSQAMAVPGQQLPTGGPPTQGHMAVQPYPVPGPSPHEGPLNQYGPPRVPAGAVSGAAAAQGAITQGIASVPGAPAGQAGGASAAIPAQQGANAMAHGSAVGAQQGPAAVQPGVGPAAQSNQAVAQKATQTVSQSAASTTTHTTVATTTVTALARKDSVFESFSSCYDKLMAREKQGYPYGGRTPAEAALSSAAADPLRPGASVAQKQDADFDAALKKLVTSAVGETTQCRPTTVPTPPEFTSSDTTRRPSRYDGRLRSRVRDRADSRYRDSRYRDTRRADSRYGRDGYNRSGERYKRARSADYRRRQSLGRRADSRINTRIAKLQTYELLKRKFLAMDSPVGSSAQGQHAGASASMGAPAVMPIVQQSQLPQTAQQGMRPQQSCSNPPLLDPLGGLDAASQARLKMRLLSMPPNCLSAALAQFPFLRPYVQSAAGVQSCHAMAAQMRQVLTGMLQQITGQCQTGNFASAPPPPPAPVKPKGWAALNPFAKKTPGTSPASDPMAAAAGMFGAGTAGAMGPSMFGSGTGGAMNPAAMGAGLFGAGAAGAMGAGAAGGGMFGAPSGQTGGMPFGMPGGTISSGMGMGSLMNPGMPGAGPMAPPGMPFGPAQNTMGMPPMGRPGTCPPGSVAAVLPDASGRCPAGLEPSMRPPQPLCPPGASPVVLPPF